MQPAPTNPSAARDPGDDAPTAPDPAPTDSELLRLYLAPRDLPCPGCGYNLRGLAADACPECNQAITLRVNLAEPRQGEFIAGLLGLALGIGFSVAFLSMGLIFYLNYGAASGVLADLWPLPLNLLVESAALAAWIRGRRRFRRLPPGTRKVLVAACWLLSIGLAAYFFAIAMS